MNILNMTPHTGFHLLLYGFCILSTMLSYVELNLYKTTYECEGKLLRITCQPDEYIKITSANYGRTSNVICNSKGSTNLNCNCISPGNKTLHVMQKRCNSQTECVFVVNNEIFEGDPCYGTVKYVDIQYKCELNLYRTVYGCEHSTFKIACQEDEHIKVVDANYGRTSLSICNIGGKIEGLNFNCISDVKTILQSKCDAQTECTLTASNDVFQGDPCYGTEKYVEVRYVCEPTSFRTVYGCEGSTLRIACPRQQIIKPINVNYGRTSMTICNKGGHTNQNTSCMSSGNKALQVVQSRCETQNGCTLEVNNAIFEEDPCLNTIKYLEVQYRCVDPFYINFEDIDVRMSK